MKKLLAFLGIITIVFVLAACTPDTGTSYQEPSFVGLSVDNTNPNNGTELVTFYKQKNQSTLLQVDIDNPDKLEIKQIVINGYSYTRFTSESTRESIFIDFDPGVSLGLKEYNIDDIQYFDGADTRDVVVDALNNQFNVYVYKEIPTVSRDNYSLLQDSIDIDFVITDTDGVIFTDSLIVELYSGDDLKTYKVLEAGLENVHFVGLDANKSYDVKIKADYNLDDNTGPHTNVILFSGTFTTLATALPSASIKNIVVGSHDITFDVDFSDEDEVTAISGLRVELYQNDTYVKEVTLIGSQEQYTFSDLYNSTGYNLKVFADYNLRDGSGLQTDNLLTFASVTTLSRSVPVPIVEDIYVEENRILFNVVINDDEESPIIFMDTLQAKVYIQGSEPKIIDIHEGIVDIQIYDVLAGNDVYIELIADYDLNDGNDRQYEQVIHVIEYGTLLNSPPIVYMDNIMVSQGYVSVELLITDVNQTLKGSIEAILYEEGVEVKRVAINTDTNEFSFNYLVEFTKNYRMEIIADYNLRDGEGTLPNEILYTQVLASGDVPKAPASEVKNIATTTSGFTFDVLVMDADNTVVDNSLFVKIYKNGTLVDTRAISVGDNTLTYDDVFNTTTIILSDNSYEIVVVADYDVNDDSGIQLEQRLITTEVMTKAKVIPSAVITDERATVDSIKVNIFVTDIDDVIEPGSLIAKAYQNGVQVGDTKSLIVGDNFDVSFSGIMSDTAYYIIVFVNYDLDNNAGIIPLYELGSTQIKTGVKKLPSADVLNIEGFIETITFDVYVYDLDGVIVLDSTKALLYVGDTATGHEASLEVGLNTEVTFENVYSNQNFNIRIVTDYNLNDGINEEEGALLKYDYVETGINQMVSADIYSVTEGIDTLTFSATVLDYDNVVAENLKAILLLDNVPTGAFKVLEVGDNPNLTFAGLISDSEYTIRLVTDYNLRDIIGEIDDYLLDSFTTMTDDYSAPIGYINSVDSTIDTITFNTVVTDVDGTSTGAFKVVLYDLEGDIVPDTIRDINLGLTEDIEFAGLYSGVGYEIRILATYDLHDGLNDQVDQIIYSSVTETLPRKAPVGNASSITITDSTLHFYFTYIDEDLTLAEDSLMVWLKDVDGVTIDSKDIYDEEITFDISLLIADFPIEVCITGDYDLSDGVGLVDNGKILCIDLRTRANEEPDVIVSGITINQDTVEARVSVIDNDNVVISGLKAQLWDTDHNLVDEVDLDNNGVTEISFNAVLIPQKLYNILIVADLNLRDGKGLNPAAVLRENTISIYNSLVPQATVYDINITVDSFTFDVNFLDNHSTYIGNAIAVLYKDGVPVGEPITLEVDFNDDETFTGLVSNAEYVVKIFIDYNNGDGNGVYENELLAEQTIQVLAKEAPTATFGTPIVTSNSIVVDITITDTDNVLDAGLVAVLYKDGFPTTQTHDLNVNANPGVDFLLLFSESEYQIRVIANYNLDDGGSVFTNQVLSIQSSTTQSNQVPDATFTAIDSDSSSITFGVDIEDVDGVITTNLKAVLYKDGIATGDFYDLDADINNVFTFNLLNSNSLYVINIQTDYDLNNGLTAIDNYVMAVTSKTTSRNDLPTAIVGNAIVTSDSITFDAIITDADGVTTTNLLAVLYANGLPTGNPIVLDVGDNLGEIFADIYSNQVYEVKIVTDYDLKDGSDAVLGYELASLVESTSSKQTPTAVISDIVITNSEFTFKVVVADPSSAIVGVTEAVLYKDGLPVGTPILLGVGTFATNTFSDLEYGAEYTLEIQTDYNNNIGDLDVVDYVLDSETQTTAALVVLESVVVDPLNVHFDVVVDDEFAILYDSYITLELYDGETQVGDTFSLNVGTPTNAATVDIVNYFNNHTYTVKVFANIDNGAGGFDVVQVLEREIVTPRKIVQAITIGEIYVTGTQINSSVLMTLPDDENSLIQTGTVVARLMKYNDVSGLYDIEVGSQEITVNDTTLSFTENGTLGDAYIITVEATVDFNEETFGVITDYILAQRSFIYTSQN